MVTFNQTPYSEAQASGKKQGKLLDEIMQIENIHEIWQSDAVLKIAEEWLREN